MAPNLAINTTAMFLKVKKTIPFIYQINKFFFEIILIQIIIFSFCNAQDSDIEFCQTVEQKMKEAATVFRANASTHGGYVYYYSSDFQTRYGEGSATKDQIWVEPPGTPTVGLAFLNAYEATADKFYLDAATEAAEALIYGQLQSGGWANAIDFDPNGNRVAQYRNGNGDGKNYSSLDDGITQSTLQFLMRADEVHTFKHEQIHEAVEVGLNALLEAQFPNGGFPQVWKAPVDQNLPVLSGSYPEYDWRTEGRIKEYWDLYTLNDNVPGYLVETLSTAYDVYDNPLYLQRLRRLGDFLLLAQMPDPQPAWSQQYNYSMNPVWARKFEPPAIASDESQEAIDTLMDIYEKTGDAKYLEPIPKAIEYLRQSQLPDGQLARFYELQTNKPLYMKRDGKAYNLTYDDSDLPSHYAFKIGSRIDELQQRFKNLHQNKNTNYESLKTTVQQIINSNWASVYQGESLRGQTKFEQNEVYISSAKFSRRINLLSDFLMMECCD